jgi:hypothetical protein
MSRATVLTPSRTDSGTIFKGLKTGFKVAVLQGGLAKCSEQEPHCEQNANPQ